MILCRTCMPQATNNGFWRLVALLSLPRSTTHPVVVWSCRESKRRPPGRDVHMPATGPSKRRPGTLDFTSYPFLQILPQSSPSKSRPGTFDCNVPNPAETLPHVSTRGFSLTKYFQTLPGEVLGVRKTISNTLPGFIQSAGARAPHLGKAGRRGI